jgi:nicotinamidase-related amidase
MKHKHTLTKSKTALLVIDVQDKFAPVIPDFDNLVTNVTRLVLTFEMFKLPIIVTEQYPEGLGNTVEKIEEQFSVLEVVEKMELAATENALFMEKVNKTGCDTFVICGIETHVCINQTALGLLSMGKTVHVVADAVGSRHAVDHSTGIRKMENAGAIVTTTETVMFELAERAGTESFRNIQTMVKAPKTKTVAGGPKAAKKLPLQKDAAEKKPVPAKTDQQAPVVNAYDDVADLFELSGAATVEKIPAKAMEVVDLVDLELAAAAQKIPEKKADTSGETKPAPKDAPRAAPKVAPKAATGVTHSSSDIDSAEEVDLSDMLSSIDTKVDAQEIIGPVSEDIDKDIADLDEIIKAEEKTEKDLPDLK